MIRNESCVPWKIEATPTFRETVTTTVSAECQGLVKTQHEGQGRDHMGLHAHWLPGQEGPVIQCPFLGLVPQRRGLEA